MKQKQKCNAFTLAEVLITLGVIGVVAAVTMPMLITNINDRVNSERHANIAYKMTQAMEQMRSHGKLVQYESTDAFVDELQKYLKITKRCDADHIAECWPTETAINSAGEEYNVADCKTRKNLLPESSTDGNNVGLVLADGASIILTYDPNANPIDVGDKIIADTNHPLPIGKGKTRLFPYTTSVTGAIDFVTDVNGKKGPNSETVDNKWHDIRSFKLATFSTTTPACIGESYNDVCVKVAGTACTWATVDCTSGNSESEDYTNYCGSTPSGYSADYWAGANKLCAEAGMTLPTVSELQSIYANRANYPTELAAYQSFGWFWSSEEDSNDPQNYSRFVFFNTGNADSYYKFNPYFNLVVLCVGNN